MKEKNRMRRIWWFKDWQLEQAEAWLSDLSAKGWRLESLGLAHAVFGKHAPERLKYKCVLHSDEASAEPYRQAGWSHMVDLEGRRNLFVLAAPADADTAALPADQTQQVSLMKRAIRGKALFCSVVMLIFCLFFYVVFSNPQVFVHFLLENDVFLLSIAALLVAFVVYQAVTFKAALSELKRQKDCAQGGGARPYAKTLMFARFFCALFVALLVLALFPARYFKSDTGAADKSKGVHIPLLQAIAEEPANAWMRQGDGVYYHRRSHGVLFPNQSFEMQAIFAEDSDASIMLEYGSYRAAAPWLAALLAEQFARESGIGGLTAREDALGFERLWLYDHPGRPLSYMLAVKGSSIYSAALMDGPVTAEEMAKMLGAMPGG
jgi:hypothetical protein